MLRGISALKIYIFLGLSHSGVTEKSGVNVVKRQLLQHIPFENDRKSQEFPVIFLFSIGAFSLDAPPTPLARRTPISILNYSGSERCSALRIQSFMYLCI